MRYLVTGGAGFIGSHLCDALLAAGHAVAVLDDLSTGRRENLDPRLHFHLGDATDPEAVRRAAVGVDGVFHLAAVASVVRGNEDWPGTHRVNQGATVLVLDTARTASASGGPVPVIYASSAAVYGDAAGAIASEASPTAPRTAYGADKLGSELHARVATLVHGVPTLGLRFFNVYGPRQDPHSPYSGVISIFTQRIGAGQGVTLHGNGTQARDFVHVSDVVTHLVHGMQALHEARPLPPVLNVCTGVATPIVELAHCLSALQGKPLSLSQGPARVGDIHRSCGSPEAAVRALGLRARVALAAGLRTLVR